MKTAVWWIRRDLRLHDNPALHAALQAADQVIPLFVLDPGLLNSSYAGAKRTAFLVQGLQTLDDALQESGSRLIVRSGEPSQVLAGLVDEAGATQVFAQEVLIFEEPEEPTSPPT